MNIDKLVDKIVNKLDSMLFLRSSDRNSHALRMMLRKEISESYINQDKKTKDINIKMKEINELYKLGGH